MADEPSEADLRLAQAIVAGAIAAAGKAESTVAWKGRVNAMIPEIAEMVDRGSPQVKRALGMVWAAHGERGHAVFRTVYRGYTDDFQTATGKKDESTRVQVALEHEVDKRHPDGVQHLRTERTDTQVGQRMLERLKQIEVGTEVLCWKVQEDLRDGDGETMAVLYHIRPLAPRKDAAVNPPRRAAAPEERAPSPSSGASIEMTAFLEATKDWPNKTVVALRRDLEFEGLWPPTTDTVDRMIRYIRSWSL